MYNFYLIPLKSLRLFITSKPREKKVLTFNPRKIEQVEAEFNFYTMFWELSPVITIIVVSKRYQCIPAVAHNFPPSSQSTFVILAYEAEVKFYDLLSLASSNLGIAI
jgi:hypothetical protein